MELFTLFGKIATNSGQANSEIDSVTNKARDSESKISAMFKRVGTAIVAAFAVEKVVEFTKNMVETTAKVQALDSQFTQTFKNSGNTAMELINKQSKDQNIQVDRLKGTWSSFFGTFRGNGADVNQSLDLTKQYMNLAADGAAYYDTNLEDVVSRLKSITMGNYEAGDAIGLNINATKLDTLAKAKYNKAFQNLSDTEKEYLILDTASKIYKNSGAMGQAAREANNYSNVVENLKATWNRFLSVIGAPVLSGVIFVLQGITGVISQLTAKMQSFNPGNFVSALSNAFSPEFIALVKEMANWIEQLANKMRDNAFQSFGPVLGTIQGFLSNLWLVVQPVAEALGGNLFSAIGLVMTIINQFIPLIALIINNFIQLGSMILANVAPAITDIMNRFNGLVQVVTEAVLVYIVPLIQQFVAMVQQLWAQNQDKLALIAELFSVLASTIAEKVTWLIGIIQQYIIPFILEIVQFISNHMNNIKGIFQGALDIIAGILNIFIGIFTGNWSRAWEGVKQVFSGAWSIIRNGFAIAVDAISAIWGRVEDILLAPVRWAVDKIGGLIDKIRGAFNNLFPIHIPMPHFSVSGSLNPIDWVKNGNMPSVGVEWYANGGILTKPMPFGVNPSTGNVMAGGEPSTGGEAIIPLNRLPEIIAEALIKAGIGQNQPIYLQIDGKTFAATIAPYTDQVNGTLVRLSERGLIV